MERRRLGLQKANQFLTLPPGAAYDEKRSHTTDALSRSRGIHGARGTMAQRRKGLEALRSVLFESNVLNQRKAPFVNYTEAIIVSL